MLFVYLQRFYANIPKLDICKIALLKNMKNKNWKNIEKCRQSCKLSAQNGPRERERETQINTRVFI